MVELPEELAVPGEYILGPGHPETASCRGQDVHAGRQVVQGHHEEGQQGATRYQGRHSAR